MGKSSINEPFSMAMLNNQMVNCHFFLPSFNSGFSSREEKFACNCLQLRGSKGSVLAISEAGWSSLDDSQTLGELRAKWDGDGHELITHKAIEVG